MTEEVEPTVGPRLTNLIIRPKAGFVGRRRLTAPQIAAGVAAIFLVIVGCAKASGHWSGNVSEEVFFHLIPNAASFSHP